MIPVVRLYDPPTLAVCAAALPPRRSAVPRSWAALRRSFAVLLVGAAATSSAFAQPAPGADVPVPKHACTKPGDHPGGLASDTQRRTWQKEYVGYTDCLKKFINDQKAIAEPHVKAYNAAVDEYNESVKTFNEQIEKARGPRSMNTPDLRDDSRVREPPSR
jgi:hypothetical protein